jgi:hypothetical protein
MRVRRGLLAVVAALALASGAGIFSARAEGALYWSSSSLLWAANTDGSMVVDGYPFGIANLIPRPSSCGVAVNGTHVYWGDKQNSAIGRMELTSAPTGRADILTERVAIDQALVSGVVDVCGVAVDPGHLYWTSAAGAVGRAGLDGSSPQRSFITGLSRPCGIAVDGGHVYWGDEVDDAIGRARLDGTQVEPEFIVGVDNICGVAVDAAHVYWSSAEPSAIGRAGLDGSDPDPGFIRLASPPCGVAVNASHIFWPYISPVGTLVGRANLDGSAAATLVSDPHYGAGCGIAVDSRVFLPRSLPASLPLRFGRAKSGRNGKMLTVPVVAPERGDLTIISPKLGWSLDKGPEPPPWVGGVFNWTLKLWPGKGKVGKRIQRQLRVRGKAPITLNLDWAQGGHEPLNQLKRLVFKR